MSGINKEAPEREIEQLLPWHAAGTLNPRDAERVEQALVGNPELARQYALVREELAETIRLIEALGAPSPNARTKLFAKIAALTTSRPLAREWRARLNGFFAGLSPRTFAWSAAVACLLLLVQAGLIAYLAWNRTGSTGYETASAPSTRYGVGTFVLIRFARAAGIDEVNAFLQANNLSIVAGPAPGGLFRVRVADTVLPEKDLNRIVQTLQQDRVIGFVGAAQ